MDRALAPGMIRAMGRMRRDRFGKTVAAALFALAAMLLGFAHATPAAPGGPVVLAPDGTVAVLCLATPEEGSPHATVPPCLACTLVGSAALPPGPPAPPCPPVSRAGVSPVAALAAPRSPAWSNAQPRAPPLLLA
jgi:hypothetical protein